MPAVSAPAVTGTSVAAVSEYASRYHSSRYSPLSAPLHEYGHLSTALRRYVPVPTPPIEYRPSASVETLST